MKPTQSPSIRQIFIYDISSQRSGIISLFLGVPGIGLLIYGLLSRAYGFAWAGIACLLVSLLLVARLILRIRSFKKTYENGEVLRSTLVFVSRNGDEINVAWQYIYEKRYYGSSTTLQRTRRTKNLAVGDQIWLVVNQDNPQNAYAQDLFTPDSPDEIRQPFIPDALGNMQQNPFPDSLKGWDGTQPKIIAWAHEVSDDIINESKENPSESEIIKLIQDVYNRNAEFCLLGVDKEKRQFMQIGHGGSPLEFCVGIDGPIYGVSAVPVDLAIKCFLSYNAGDEFWKTALPWIVHIKSIKDSKRKR